MFCDTIPALMQASATSRNVSSLEVSMTLTYASERSKHNRLSDRAAAALTSRDSSASPINTAANTDSWLIAARLEIARDRTFGSESFRATEARAATELWAP